MVKQCPNKDAIEIEVTQNDSLQIISGHHTLGYTLDLWNGKRTEGNRLNFSNWDDRGKNFQINWIDMTISPRGDPNLVLGWSDHLQLVKKNSK